MYKGLEHNKKRKKIKRLFRNKTKLLVKYIAIISVYGVIIYLIDKLNISLFIKLAILYIITRIDAKRRLL